MIKHLVRLSAGIALAFFSHLAVAGLLGTTVTHCADTTYSGAVSTDVTLCDPGTAQPSPVSAVVDAAIEFNIAGNRFFDFGDDTLTISYIQPVGSPSPDLIIFTMEQAITGVTLEGGNPLSLSWTFSGNLLGVLIDAPLENGTVVLRFGPQSIPVPEPGSLALVVLGMLALTQAARRKQRS